MSNDEEEQSQEDGEFIEVHLKIPKPEPTIVVAPQPPTQHISITNVTSVNSPPEKVKTGVPEMDREPKKPELGAMKSSGFSTAKKVEKFGSVLEKDAVQATQDFRRRGFTVKDSRAS
jgi:hypothetical protein